MKIKCALVIFTALVLVSCSCRNPTRVSPIQREDKKLTCRDIIMEMNESEHYREYAFETKAITMDEILMPSCWIGGYIDAEKAMSYAEKRMEYLGHIYDLLDCAGEGAKSGITLGDLPNGVGPLTPGQSPVNALPSGAEHYPPASPDTAVHSAPLPPVVSGPSKNMSEYMHEHMIESTGERYLHAHPHTGPHRHEQDAPVLP